MLGTIDHDVEAPGRGSISSCVSNIVAGFIPRYAWRCAMNDKELLIHCSTSLFFLLLNRPVPSVQHAHPTALFPPLPPPQDFPPPPGQLIAPPSPHQDPAHHIHDPHAQRQQPPPLLSDGQQDRLDVEFEEDARHGALVDAGRLGGDGVLVCDYCVGGRGEDLRGSGGGGGFGRGGSGVDCRDDGKVVLVFVEVGAGCGVSFVQGVEEGGIEGTEG